MNIEKYINITKQYKKLYKYAKEKDKTLRCGINFKGVAEIQHADGSKLTLEHAEVEEKGDFLIVYTEHLGFFVFHKEDLDESIDGHWKYEKY